MPFKDVNILIVEDQRPFLLLLRGLVANLGAKNVMTATQADQAIKFCRNHKVEVVVCDLHLGQNKKNGYELYIELKSKKLIPLNAVFLIISADATRPVVLGSIEHKPSDYLLKPFSQAQLKNRLNKAWEKNHYFEQVSAAFAAKEMTKALEELHKLKNPPKIYQRFILEWYTEVYWRQKDYIKALSLLEAQSELLPTQWLQLAMGKTYLAMRQYHKSIACAKNVLKLNHFDPEALDVLAQANSALEQHEEALNSIRKAIKYSPFSLQRHRLANQIARENNDHDVLISSAKSSWELSKHTSDRHISYWCMYINSLLDSAEHADSKTQQHRLQQEALLQLHRGRFDEAISRTDDPFSLDIFDLVVHARIEAIDGKLIESKRLLMNSQAAIEQQFADYPISLAPGSLSLMIALGDYEEALQLRHIIDKQETPLDALNAQEMQRLSKQATEGEQQYAQVNRQGISLYQQNLFSKAKDCFNQALKLSPVNAGIALNLLQCVSKLLDDAPKNEAALVNEAKQVYKILKHAPLREQHLKKFDELKESLQKLGIAK